MDQAQIKRVSNFLANHRAMRTLVGQRPDDKANWNYMRAVEEFAASQVQRQNVSLVSNSRRETVLEVPCFGWNKVNWRNKREAKLDVIVS